jgi:hypothetical protein
VKDATSATVIQELLSVVHHIQQSSGSNLPKEKVRRVVDLLLGIKTSELSRDSIESLRSCKLWPCRPNKDASLILVSTAHAFFVPDHQNFLEILDWGVPVLELTSHDAMDLKPLFMKLGLESRFLSKAVTMTASAADMSLEAFDLSNDLFHRASALF